MHQIELHLAVKVQRIQLTENEFIGKCFSNECTANKLVHRLDLVR